MKTKKFFCNFIFLLAAIFIPAQSGNIAHAEMYRGMAAIVNGDMAKAQREAREDAMRSCIESKLGAKVTGHTETDMGMVTVDRIMVDADGYVRPKGNPNFTVKDGVMFCEIDLEASAEKIVKAGDDIKSQIQNAINADTTGRTNIVVAVSGRDENGNLQNDSNTSAITRYLEDVMRLQGFTVQAPDEIVEYISGQDFDNAIAGADARKYVRNEMPQANGILRGSLSTVSVKKSGGVWTATVKASFQLVGTVSGEVNSYVEYFSAVDTSGIYAIEKARQIATQKSAEEIAKRAAETIQGETRGGVQHTKILIEVAGITDRTGQGERVLNAIKNGSCRVLRSFYDKKDPTTLKIFVDATNAGSLQDIVDNIKNQLPGNLESGDEDTERRGNARIYFRYRG